MKIQMSETNGKTSIDVKFENEELQWAQNKPETFDKFVNNLKEICITSSNNKKEILINEKNNEKEILINEKNNKKEMRNAILPPIIKGIETINNISNNLYNYYTDQNGEEVSDLPYK